MARKAMLMIGFVLLVAWQIALNLPLMSVGSPYEGWDEVATYNTARILSGPKAEWCYRYGTLESLVQIVATQYFLLFDPIGAQFHHYNYANNAYGSLNDDLFVYDKMKPGDFGYNYYRGLDDRTPIFISRALHFWIFYALVATIGLLTIAALGGAAIYVVVPMLCLTVNAETFLQTIQALPNGINTMLCFAIVLSIGFALARRRGALLIAAAGLLAVALNFKIDVLPLGVVLAMALIWHGMAKGVLRIVGAVVAAFAVFLAVYALTNPLLLLAPQLWFRRQFPNVDGSDQPLLQTFAHNLLVVARDLKLEMLPTAWQEIVPTLVLPLVLLGGAVGVTYALRRQPIPVRWLLLPALAICLLWLVPIAFVRSFYPRYELNGIAAFYALVALALSTLHDGATRAGRRVAVAILLVLVGQYGLMLADGAALAARIAAKTSMVLPGDGNSGYALDQSRNIIERDAIETMQHGGYDRTILVDQHGYLDLRPLRLAGLDPIYVNMGTLAETLARLPRSKPHLLVFSPGSYETDPAWWSPWIGQWSPDLEQQYDAYLTQLSAYPVLADTGGPPQRLLSPAPVDAHDRMILAVVPAPERD